MSEPDTVREQQFERVPVKPGVHYVICTNPRSGSWLLSEGLASTAVAGNPREWFNLLEQQRWAALWRLEHESDLTAEAYLRLVSEKSATANGVSGVKLHYFHLDVLKTSLESLDGFQGLTPFQAMKTLYPNSRYIWLRRRDKVRQAISLQLAFDTLEWWSVGREEPLYTPKASREPIFDPYAIARCEAILKNHDARWSRFLRSHAIKPLVVYYEDLAADYAGTITRVLHWLGLPDAAAVSVPPPNLRRQSSARNEVWRDQYLTFRKGGGAIRPKAGGKHAGDPLLTQGPGLHPQVSDLWRQWIARSRLKGLPDETIVAVLVANRHDPAEARDEVSRGAGS